MRILKDHHFPVWMTNEVLDDEFDWIVGHGFQWYDLSHVTFGFLMLCLILTDLAFGLPKSALDDQDGFNPLISNFLLSSISKDQYDLALKLWDAYDKPSDYGLACA